MGPVLALALTFPVASSFQAVGIHHFKRVMSIPVYMAPLKYDWSSSLFPRYIPTKPRPQQAGFEENSPAHAIQSHRLVVQDRQVRHKYILAVKAEKARKAAAAAARAAAREARRAQHVTLTVSHASTVTHVAAPAPVYSGSPQAIAASMLPSYGWSSSEMGCLVALWNRESGWNYAASNSGSGAYGIPQALPGSKMASAGADWQTNPATQIKWGLGYIQATYGSPCAAWAHSQATGWY